MSISETVQLTQQLVRIRSENPTGTEKECAAFIKRWLESIDGMDVEVQTVERDRENIIVRYKAAERSSLPPLVILAHMDTVPIEGDWTYDPLGAAIIDGKMYGRGACDMKSGLACALSALKEVVTKKIATKRDVYVIVTVDEEGPYMKGAIALVDGGYIKEDALLLATEPTNLTVATVHKGTIWYELLVEGRSAHGGNAHLGADAVHAASEIITRVKDKVARLPYDHAIFGKPAISVGTISGGHKTNMVAGSCRVELDFRLVPPMTKEEANRIVQEAAQEGCRVVDGTSVQINHYGHERPPLETEENSVLIEMIKEAFFEVEGKDIEVSGFPAYTDASMIALKTGNRNVAVFGPGHLNEAHAVDEFVEIEQIDRCKDVLVKLMQK